MRDPFKYDAYPGAGRILFVGDVHGSHARSWLEIVDAVGLNVRCFGSANGVVPTDMRFPTHSPLPQHPRTRWSRTFLTNNWRCSALLRTWDDLHGQSLTRRAFQRVLRNWEPDIVHTFGVFPASSFYLKESAGLTTRRPFWVVQARGGPDIEVNRHLQGPRVELTRILKACDAFIADTDENLAAAVELGLDPAKRSSIGRVPGTGGVDVDAIGALNTVPPSKRQRLMLVPKAYEHVQSKVLPILEALQLCWERIAPCRVVLTAVNDEVLPWISALPRSMQDHVEVHQRLPRQAILELMARARVNLAPSLLDGIPNTLLETMAAGSIPIVSPLATITPYVSDPANVFFARNLFPAEIADAVVRAFDDAAKLDEMADRNLALVRRIGDRRMFAGRIGAFYKNAIDLHRDNLASRFATSATPVGLR